MASTKSSLTAIQPTDTTMESLARSSRISGSCTISRLIAPTDEKQEQHTLPSTLFGPFASRHASDFRGQNQQQQLRFTNLFGIPCNPPQKAARCARLIGLVLDCARDAAGSSPWPASARSGQSCGFSRVQGVLAAKNLAPDPSDDVRHAQVLPEARVMEGSRAEGLEDCMANALDASLLLCINRSGLRRPSAHSNTLIQ